MEETMEEDTYFSKWDDDIYERAVFFTINAQSAQIRMPFHPDILVLNSSPNSPIRALVAFDMLPGSVVDIGKLGKVADLDPVQIKSVLLKFGEALYPPHKPIVFASKEEFRTASDIISVTGMTVGKLEVAKWMEAWCSTNLEENVETLAWITAGRTNEFHKTVEKIKKTLIMALSREANPPTRAITLLSPLSSDHRGEILASALYKVQTVLVTKKTEYETEKTRLVDKYTTKKDKVIERLHYLRENRKIGLNVMCELRRLLE